MGECGQIFIRDTGVYLYAHWSGYDLKQALHEALNKQWRWSDVEYLTRIIFDVMVGEDQGQETSFGIGTIQHLDLNYPLLEVDVEKQTITEDGKKWSFEEFIKEKFKDIE